MESPKEERKTMTERATEMKPVATKVKIARLI
jgi:hypothetical protein